VLGLFHQDKKTKIQTVWEGMVAGGGETRQVLLIRNIAIVELRGMGGEEGLCKGGDGYVTHAEDRLATLPMKKTSKNLKVRKTHPRLGGDDY